MPCRWSPRAGGGHRRFQPDHGGDRRRGPVERPVEPAEGDGAHTDGGLQGHDRCRQVEATVGGPIGQRPERQQVGGDHDDDAGGDGPLAQSGRFVLQVVQAPPLGGEPVDDPVGQPEQADLLRRRRVDGKPVRVLGVPLGPLHLGRAAVLPDGALAEQPMGGRPGEHEHDRLPPPVPGQQDGRGDAGDQPDEAVGDEVHAV